MPFRYINHGFRDYGAHPFPPFTRKYWEIQISVRGSLAPLLKDGPVLDARPSTLWVFPPSYAHGWINPVGESVEIRVFHVTGLPEPLKGYIESKGYLELQLDSAAIQCFIDWYKELSEYRSAQDALTELRSQRVLCDMCLLLLNESEYSQPLASGSIAATRVESALDWYAGNLQDMPSLSDTAKAVHISEPQLRRHFRAVRGQSPRQAFQEIRFDRARELLSQPDLSLESIAVSCGYSCLSAFSRAWKAYFGQPPRSFRLNS